MKLKISPSLFILLFSLPVAVIILLFNWFYLKEARTLFQAVNIFAMFIVGFPIILVKYLSYRRKKEIEDMFPVFLRDFVEAIRSGMNLTQALDTISKNDYRALSPFIRRMAAQLQWGLPVDKVLLKFAKATKSKVIGRTVSSVIESHRFGGNLAETFEALSTTAVEIDRLREERKLYLQSQLITGYIIFFVFLGVIIALEKFLVPSLTQVQQMPLGNVTAAAAMPRDLGKAYKDLFFHLILMQGFFAGLAVGKMAEGAVVAGLKHSLFMMFIGGVVFVIVG